MNEPRLVEKYADMAAFYTDDGGDTWLAKRQYDRAILRFATEFLDTCEEEFFGALLGAFLRGITHFYYPGKDGGWTRVDFGDEVASVLPCDEPTKEADKWSYHYLKVLSE